MMQSAGNLRVAFVTTHIPLSAVSDAVSVERITEVAGLLEDAVRAEGIEAPKLAAAAINPHAGENGYMGLEDENIVKPALEELRGKGMDIDGPFPPDTLFIKETRERYDGILSMYHDQGHIPFKMLAFDCGVNSTLGLPIIRTSVDHGTAFEIAWRGCADTGSLYEAVKLAVKRARNRKQFY
jgi:4-hydroxythreonine-4-phosphate dehydrogenase